MMEGMKIRKNDDGFVVRIVREDETRILFTYSMTRPRVLIVYVIAVHRAQEPPRLHSSSRRCSHHQDSPSQSIRRQ